MAGPNFQVQRNRYDAPIAQRSNAYLVRIIVIDNKYRKICEMAIGTCEDKHVFCSLSNQLNIVCIQINRIALTLFYTYHVRLLFGIARVDVRIFNNIACYRISNINCIHHSRNCLFFSFLKY